MLYLLRHQLEKEQSSTIMVVAALFIKILLLARIVTFFKMLQLEVNGQMEFVMEVHQ